MAHHVGDFHAALAAASGEDPALLVDLRQAFLSSLGQQVDLLARARCDGNWQIAAQRLKSLGASFHAGDLIALAEEAIAGAPGDPAVVRKLRGLGARFAAIDGG